MRIFWWILGIVIVVGAGAAYVHRDLIAFALLQAKVVPHQPFSEASTPPAPDYADAKSWAALPDTADGADFTVPGKTTDNQATAQADVFFVHPTTYIKNDRWNAPLDDVESKRFVDEHMLPGEASVFNGCCRVYAPRYRQASFGAFLDAKGSGTKAIDLAYKDVAVAFDYFLANYNKGRPFILAGHSQGSGHLQRLIAERITGTPLAKQMIAAYAIGWPINAAVLGAQAPDVPVCATADQVNCLVSWNTVGPHAPKWGDPASNVCVNPLTWKADGVRADATANKGALVLRSIEESAADAQCVGGRLVVTDVRATALLKAIAAAPISLGPEIYHLIDYPLFYMNLRENAAARVAHVVLADGPAPATTPAAPAHP